MQSEDCAGARGVTRIRSVLTSGRCGGVTNVKAVVTELSAWAVAVWTSDSVAGAGWPDETAQQGASGAGSFAATESCGIILRAQQG